VISVAGDAEVSQAADMADRFNRLFLRTLRQLRDLRRYNLPVTINNPQQVNIAAEGGQQVNMQRNKQGKKPAKKESNSTNNRKQNQRTTNPKQLAPKSSEVKITTAKRQDSSVARGG